MRLVRAGIHFYLIGIFILTLGIALTIQSTLGAAPYDALLVGLNRTFGLTVGTWEYVVGLTMILGNALAERKKPEFFALITSFVTGLAIDSWLFLLRGLVEPVTWVGAWAILLSGIVLMALGVAIYLQSTIAPNPLDRSMMVVSRLTGWNVAYARASISTVLVIFAFFLSGAIGVGTFINAALSGVMISFLMSYIQVLKKSVLCKRGEGLAS
ncbi:YitT family protein [Lentibacillus halophilus]|uniref:YitT family protein n=1 Tax=Lentibacillus halophilus TaxID=295065 RepID=A0ABP3J6E6_9BACI